MNRIEQLRISGKLPSPKGVALTIMEISLRENATLSEVTKVVQTDPALSSRLLRLANSSAEASRPLASINDAVMRLGMVAVRQIAMGFSLVDQYHEETCQGFDYQGFWSHSLFMALASQELGRVIRIASPDDLFACGLLAQIGKLALGTAYPVDYAAILEQQASGEELLALERERLSVDHCEITAAILADCGIAKVLAEPIYYHEAPDLSDFSEGSRPYQLTHVFYQARRMADLGLAFEAERHSKISELLRLGGKIGLDVESFGELFDRVVQQWHEWSKLLKVLANPLPAFSVMTSAPLPRPEQEEPKTACKRVLLVEDEPTTRIMMEGVLHKLLGCKVYTAENGKDALTMALEVIPQIIITDWLMPVMDGLEFCRTLRATDWGQSIYVIMLTGVETEENIVEAFEAGVDDYVTKPMNIRALNARMRAALHYVNLLETWEYDRAQLKQFAADLAISNRRLEHTAMTDLLTGLPNRRAGMEALSRNWSASMRTGKPVAAMMIDVDLFKSINDRHGHAVGDQVLQEVAKAIQSSARKDDSVCRMGGEEFLLLCHDTDLQSALLAAERLRKMVKALKISIDGMDIQTSVSIGVAGREASMEDADDMILGADKALYAAKNAGRNQTCLFAQGRTHCT
ncbi:Stalked cell differentiation-controlling protein [Candidatus Nitrotoga sp. BS]|uniref:GGDEF domain-containing response regulator n=1 Tax=Candidatus Nitrotoga sp. BS TaxID=2890408 RepID=UPI001EF392B2|nr:diguanylate cyclase [Candidatus Nitrotoga sp. BS]CAH1206648.1 Stalked cell differentiation-controlling protein [Candidatus Nitrotoga sp. BS]